MTADKNILDKIAKVLRLADNAGTEGERDAAIGRAQAMAFKYNLDLSEIDLEEEDNQVTEVSIPGRHDDRASWRQMLLGAVASVNFCRVIVAPWRNTVRLWVAGRKHNAEIVYKVYQYIEQQIEAECMRQVSIRGQVPRYALIAVRRYIELERNEALLMNVPKTEFRPGLFALDTSTEEYKQAVEIGRQKMVNELKGDAGLLLVQSLTGLTKSYASEVRPFIKRGELAPEVVRDLKVWRDSFYVGAVQRVHARLLIEHNRLRDDAGTTGRDLVRREDALVEEYVKDKYGEGTIDNKDVRLDYLGVQAGQEAGANIELSERERLFQGQRELGA